MNAWLVAIALAVAALTAGDAPDDSVKKDRDQFQGTWTIQGITHGGNEAPADQVAGMQMVIDGDKYTLKKNGNVLDEGTFKFGTGQKIDIQSAKGEMKKLNGIYKIDGDTHKEALTPDGSDRPTELASKAGSGVILIVMQRDKK